MRSNRSASRHANGYDAATPLTAQPLKSAAELARANTMHVPNESEDYRRARNQLLAEEIELRRHIEGVAELRRKLPSGGEVTTTHQFVGEMGLGTADPGQDPRGAPDLDPLWTILDTTPEGRGADWYPKLNY